MKAAAKILNIQNSITERSIEYSNSIEEQIKALRAKEEHYRQATAAFGAILPFLSKQLSKLHVELVRVHIIPNSNLKIYSANIAVKSLKGFEYVSGDDKFNEARCRANDMEALLFEALASLKITPTVNINPFLLQGGVGGYSVGDTFTIQIQIRNNTRC